MRKVVVYQEEISDCGVACLLSIIRHYNGDANLEILRIDSNTTKKGVTAYDLIECAKKYGFNAIGYKDFELSKYKFPCILHFQINQSLSHFVVLYEISKSGYKIMDPAKGFITIKDNKLKELFTGNIIVLEPLNNLPKIKNEDVVKKKIYQQLKSNKTSIIKIVMLNIFFIILSIINSFYVKIYNYQEYIIHLSLLFLVINSLIYLFSYIIYKKIYKLEDIINYNLSDNFFEHILKLPLKYLHLKDPGEIVKRSNEIELINDIILNSFISMLLDILIIISIFSVIFRISIIASELLMVVIIISLIYSCLTIKKLKQLSRLSIDASTEYNNVVIDGIYGLTSIKHSRSEEFLKDKIKTKLKNKERKTRKYSLQYKKIETIKTMLLSILRVAINILLIGKIYKNAFSFESLIIVDVLVEIVINSSSNVISCIMELIFVKNLFNKANDFYNIPIETNNDKRHFKNGDIKIKNLSYNYSVQHPLIINFTTNIKQGEKIIIKGESGAGKSTLCKILYREIDDYKGEILINGNNIKKINLEDYRNNILYSSQTERIFSGSIRENILLGMKVNNDQLNKVIEICELNRILNKRTLGLDTLLYSGGEELSGGERQLIILARALVRNFSILILDETLSEVNEDVENKVLNNIFEYFKDKTIIYISHKDKKEYFKRIINV